MAFLRHMIFGVCLKFIFWFLNKYFKFCIHEEIMKTLFSDVIVIKHFSWEKDLEQSLFNKRNRNIIVYKYKKEKK